MLGLLGLVVLLVAVAGGAVWFGKNWNHSSAEDSGDYYGKQADTPREAPTYAQPGGTGGAMGRALRASLTSAGFSCTRTPGNRSALLTCVLTGKDPAPFVAKVTVLTGREQVVRVDADVRPDPAWSELDSGGDSFEGGPDVSAVAYRTFTVLGLAAIPDGERPEFDKAMRTSLSERSRETAKTSVADVAVMVRTSGPSTFELRRDQASGQLDYTPGLSLVTPKEVSAALGKQGLSCRRAEESMTCTRGDVKVHLTFPRPRTRGPDQNITELTATAPAVGGAVNPELRTTARTLTGLVVGKFGGAGPAQSWAGGCFGDRTAVTVAGASTLVCSPRLTGTTGSPRVVSQEFAVRPVQD
ncbi:hypothetical protein ACWDWO_01400 [Actinopolymorpha singaporensis]|uniref:Uncharacterized protein n=1 Tax=Actinopolymorpha singaporensis TaxID=117157 RepID=A0A1H1VCT8_9ACTN|nr:hypothetical protein [Actinopolymorpha singaporensis]SDS82545.1 hypothetical protein SAMN04489717_4008 [Actinopolymorpha singaporensis]